MPRLTLLVGNGPNRQTTDSHSWGGVLKQLANFSDQPALLEGLNTKPFTVLFEEIALRAAPLGITEEQLKKRAASWLLDLRPNWVHERLLGVCGRHLLTTNYDYCIERSRSGLPGACVDLHNESRYSLFRCREVGRTRVWHIHGEIEKPATLTLGYDHYVGYLYRMRTYLTPSTAKMPASTSGYRSPFLNRHYEFDESAEPYSWVDIFLRDDVHIVGFGCDYSEIDFWWLLSLKHRLRLNDARVPNKISVGTTRFYYLDSPPMRTAQRAHLRALQSFGVELVCTPVRNQDFVAGWDALCYQLERAT